MCMYITCVQYPPVLLTPTLSCSRISASLLLFWITFWIIAHTIFIYLQVTELSVRCSQSLWVSILFHFTSDEC